MAFFKSSLAHLGYLWQITDDLCKWILFCYSYSLKHFGLCLLLVYSIQSSENFLFQQIVSGQLGKSTILAALASANYRFGGSLKANLHGLNTIYISNSLLCANSANSHSYS